MSYSRTMTGSVAWHTSGSVSYPASESGGSVGYSASGSVPVTITVHVDTAPFDASVAGCNAEVAALGTSVVAMSGAQCEAIRGASKEVSAHITGGFFSLVKSEISQNMAALFAKLNSQVLLVMEKTKAAVKQRDVMQGDYNRALARYAKVFGDLDDECKRRIEVLDRSAYRLGTLSKEMQKRQIQSGAETITYTEDGEVSLGQLFAAYIKSKTNIIINGMAKVMAQRASYMAQMAALLREAGAKEGREEVLVPALYVQCLNMDDKDKVDDECIASGTEGLLPVIDTVKGEVEARDAWREMNAEEREGIKRSFAPLAEKYLSEDGQDEAMKKRVYDVMMSLLGQEIEVLQ